MQTNSYVVNSAKLGSPKRRSIHDGKNKDHYEGRETKGGNRREEIYGRKEKVTPRSRAKLGGPSVSGETKLAVFFYSEV